MLQKELFCAEPHVIGFINVPTRNSLCEILIAAALPCAPTMSVINFNSMWFRCYSQAKLESDPVALRTYVKVALDAIHQAILQPSLEDGERQAIVVAINDLHSMEREELPTFQKQPRGQSRNQTSQARQK
jgi:hypothetical protein